MADATETEIELQQCPTRIDGAPVRIAQRIPTSLCQDRQRGLYHKCFLCTHANGRVLRGDVESAARAVTQRVPQFAAAERNGHAHDGAHTHDVANGAASNGTAPRAAAANGALNGTAANGAVSNAAASNGAVAKHEPARNGGYANGAVSSRAHANGMRTNGAASRGGAMNGVRTNGHAIGSRG